MELPESGITQGVYQHDAAGPQTKAVKVCEQKRHCTMGRNAPGIGTCLSGIPVFRWSVRGSVAPFGKKPPALSSCPADSPKK
jgi:hypothetical protein